MPSSTPNLALPYPLAADPANVPSDILALATRIDNLAGSGVFSKAPTRQIFTSGTGTYTTPAGCRAILVECVGAGGGGGGCNTVSAGQVSAGGGGGGGSYSASLISNPVASYAYQVGAGCAGGAAGANPGATPAAANDTTFGASLVVAKAGGPGQGNTSGAITQVTQGGSPAVGVNGTGDLRIDGSGGGAAICVAAGQGVSGPGGAGAVYGSARNGTASAGASSGQTGTNYGGGGSGGIRTAATGTQAGGNGAGGLIIVTEFY